MKIRSITYFSNIGLPFSEPKIQAAAAFLKQARALFEAAGEPKELRWYEGGHWPPQSAVDQVADWLAAQLLSGSAARPLGHPVTRLLPSR